MNHAKEPVNEKETNFLSVIIYVYNNEDDIYKFLNKVNTLFRQNFCKFEIICVNDASTDASVDEIKRYINSEQNICINVINMSYYQGREQCMNAGKDIAIGDYVFEFDSLLQEFDDDIIMKTYDKLFEGYDIVSVRPQKKKSGVSELFYKALNKYADFEYDVDTEAFRVLSRRAINRVQSMSKVIPYRKALYANCGLKLFSFEFPLKVKKDTSKATRNMNRELAEDAMILFTNAAYKFATMITIVMMAATVILGIYTLCMFMMGISIVGWSTIMLVLSSCFFCVFGILTIILKYLEVLVSLIFKRQSYVYESIEKISS